MIDVIILQKCSVRTVICYFVRIAIVRFMEHWGFQSIKEKSIILIRM